MPTARKILGQTTTAANTDAQLYVVPASTDTVVSTITVAETGGAVATFKICVLSAAGATAAGKAIAWNVPLAANQVLTFTLGITLAASNVIEVQASTTTVTFTAFGQENS